MSDFTKESQEKDAQSAGYFYHQIIALKAENSKLKTEVTASENSHYRSLQLWGEKEDRLKSEIERLRRLVGDYHNVAKRSWDETADRDIKITELNNRISDLTGENDRLQGLVRYHASTGGGEI